MLPIVLAFVSLQPFAPAAAGAHRPPAPSAITQKALPQRRALAVPLGGTVDVSFKSVRSFSVSDAKTVNVALDRNGVTAHLMGKNAGDATLTLVLTDGSRLVYEIKVS